MDFLFMALGHPVRLAIVEYLLGIDEELHVSPREATQADLRSHFNLSSRGNLTKHFKKLSDAHLLVSSPGPRADQQVYSLRQPELLAALLRNGARLDAVLATELATLQTLEAEAKAAVAKRIIGN
jgi:DNA-binding MarR family transcriptional regulator